LPRGDFHSRFRDIWIGRFHIDHGGRYFFIREDLQEVATGRGLRNDEEAIMIKGKPKIIFMGLLISFGCDRQRSPRKRSPKKEEERLLAPRDVVNALLRDTKRNQDLDADARKYFTRKAWKYIEEVEEKEPTQKVLGERCKGDKADVHVLLTSYEGKKKEYELTYKLRKEDGLWKIYGLQVQELLIDLERPDKIYKQINRMLHSKEELEAIEKVMKMLETVPGGK
jgi:hypothetical protein